MTAINELDIVGKVKDFLATERKSWAPACNYASSAGHPCSRKLVYDRLNWQEKLLPEPVKLLIFREGNMHEEAIMQLLRDAGIQVIEQQRPFEWPQLQVRGKLDGRIPVNGNKPPLEVKSMNSFEWEKMNSVEDLRNSNSFWVRGYYDQFQLYLFMSHEEVGIMLLKNKQTGQLKQLIIRIDYEHAEKVAKKLELVNKHVAEKTYPDRITDKAVCQYCDFRHICLPDENGTAINIVDDAELLELLEEREALKDSASSYEKVDKKIKEKLESSSEGTYLAGGRFQIKISSYKHKFANVPDEVKRQYEEVKQSTRINITVLK